MPRWSPLIVSGLIGVTVGVAATWFTLTRVLTDVSLPSGYEARLHNDTVTEIFAVRLIRHGHSDDAVTLLEGEIDGNLLGLREALKMGTRFSPNFILQLQAEQTDREKFNYRNPDAPIASAVDDSFKAIEAAPTEPSSVK